MVAGGSKRKAPDTFHKYSNLDKRNYIQKLFTKGFYQSYGLYTRSEQQPNPDSRVVLSEEKDELLYPGQPALGPVSHG